MTILQEYLNYMYPTSEEKKKVKEIIIIETNKPQKLKNFLNKEHFSYKVYQEPEQDQGQLKKQLFTKRKSSDDKFTWKEKREVGTKPVLTKKK